VEVEYFKLDTANCTTKNHELITAKKSEYLPKINWPTVSKSRGPEHSNK